MPEELYHPEMKHGRRAQGCSVMFHVPHYQAAAALRKCHVISTRSFAIRNSLVGQSHHCHRKRIMALEKGYRTFDSTQPILVAERDHPRKSKVTAIWLGVVLSFFVVMASFIPHPPYFLSPAICYLNIGNPRFDPPKSWSDFKNQSFAVGFDLTAGYG